MSQTLVYLFSASGVTANAAKILAQAARADLYEIKPEVPYTRADLNWMEKKSRSTVEMNDPSSRPAINGKIERMEQYQNIFIGFPIWWYREPSIIDTFLESYDFTGKRVILFATSGGSGLGKTDEGVKKIVPGAKVENGRMLNGNVSEADVKAGTEPEFIEKREKLKTWGVIRIEKCMTPMILPVMHQSPGQCFKWAE